MLNKIKIFFLTTMALISFKAMACPACVGAVQGSEDAQDDPCDEALSGLQEIWKIF